MYNLQYILKINSILMDKERNMLGRRAQVIIKENLLVLCVAVHVPLLVSFNYLLLVATLLSEK